MYRNFGVCLRVALKFTFQFKSAEPLLYKKFTAAGINYCSNVVRLSIAAISAGDHSLQKNYFYSCFYSSSSVG